MLRPSGVTFTLMVCLLVHSTSAILNSTSVIVRDNGFTIYPCHQLPHREEVLEPSAMGKWFVVETIEHRDDAKVRGTKLVNECPSINLYRPNSMDLRLTWYSKAGDILYPLRMTDPENAGFWMVWEPQSGTALNRDYHQFLGTIQVLEATPTQMLLTFCAYKRTHHSVILVRNTTAPYDVAAAHRRLTEYGLPQVGDSLTCQNASGTAHAAAPLVFSLLIALLVSYRY